ncbi:MULTISPECIES: peptidoglycan editing factor PgeF [unclassified Saccharibacter]|uniref:peptidoglycan editing factor PgeF n=1 Tax=unclassified Saccharibacter TaxID=2648722 RepID=UPI001322D66F|nr:MULTISPECIES: peptidoglycan editing factor PgeF [unclassified Saccharibacter]MXV36355.1 peptidoglycan editing factor PgeF [Saccharibacter sp. EH611]MXV57517.1 peptidoglycan editing factor PgeF [Saccharibacter sp. EH70]MXV65176.1 peptidoglycan editing factor PgeF [Saccharibacter sp. EH60]
MKGILPCLAASSLPVGHAFFTREGGVSAPPYETLNAGWNTADHPDALAENWRRYAAHMRVLPEALLSMEQVHGVHVITVDDEMPLWSVAERPQADALVSARSDVVLTVMTADCAPVLFSSHDGRVVGAAHAGWRGAVGGVLEATVQNMRALGAGRITAVIGPSIAQSSYEIGEEMKTEIIAQHPQAERFFVPAVRAHHVFFDLPGFCAWRLQLCADVQVENMGVDTRDDARFFSHRQACLAGDARTGRQLSAIRAFSRGMSE